MASSLVCCFIFLFLVNGQSRIYVQKEKRGQQMTDGFLFPSRFYKPMLSYPHSLWKCVLCWEVIERSS